MTEDSLWGIVSMEGEKNFISFLSYLMSISFVTQFFCFYHYLPILPSTMLYVVASFNCKTGILEKDVDQTYLQYCNTNYHDIISQKIWTLRYCISATEFNIAFNILCSPTIVMDEWSPNHLSNLILVFILFI